MKIVVFGAHGTIGSKISEALQGHQLIKVSRSAGDYQADLADPHSLRAVFEKIGRFDALISAAGQVAWVPLQDLGPEQWEVGIRSKFMGQVNLVSIGKDYINDGGSFTLTTGVLSEDFIKAGTSATAINRAVEGFAQSAAQEIGRGLRINVVSPNLLQESAAAYGDLFAGHPTVAGAKVAQAYKRSVLGLETGKIIRVF